MRLKPVCADPDTNFEWNTPLIGFDHQPDDKFVQLGLLFGHDIKHQFVVDLHYHARLQAAMTYLAVDVDHGYFDYVGSRALQRSVDGIALCIAADHCVPRADFGQEALTLHDGRHIAVFAGLLDYVFHIFVHSGIRLHISFDKLFGLRTRYRKTFGQTEGRYAVDDAEIGRLGLAALIVAHIGGVEMIDFGGSCAVYVLMFDKRLDHRRVAAEIGHQTQLDLRIVGAQHHIALVRDESPAHFHALVCADRYILQIRIGRRYTPGGRNRLIIGRVYLAGLRIDKFRQRVDIGGQQLFKSAYFED